MTAQVAGDAMMLVCTGCGALNRAPTGRALTAGKCGRCKAPLATPEPVDIDGAQLARLTAVDTGPFVVDVWAPWCGPCRTMAPSYAAAARALADRLRLFKLNSDENQAAASQLGLRGVPTLIAWKHGRQVAHQAGAQTGRALTEWIERVVAAS